MSKISKYTTNTEPGVIYEYKSEKLWFTGMKISELVFGYTSEKKVYWFE